MTLSHSSPLHLFPKFELSYEIIAHNKVQNADILLAIPDGKKYFVWFTQHTHKNMCYLVEFNESKNRQIKVTNMTPLVTDFSDEIVETIFYGTTILYNGVQCFCVEDLYFYKGTNVSSTSYLDKLETLSYVLKNEVSQIALNDSFTVFGLPLMSGNFYELLRDIPTLPYKVQYIQYRFFNAKKIIHLPYFAPKCKPSDSQPGFQTCVFKVTADIEPDIYNLFKCENNGEEYVDVAFIPDYKTSVMMNKLFRKIKENDNLDAIEESDNDEEFENKDEDRFVYLDRSFQMVCEYNRKFKKWCPVRLAT